MTKIGKIRKPIEEELQETGAKNNPFRSLEEKRREIENETEKRKGKQIRRSFSRL